MNKFNHLLLTLLYGFIGIVLISAAPALFNSKAFFDLSSYFTALKSIFTAFVTPADWTLIYMHPSTYEMMPFSFSDFLSGPYLYSMPILLMALALAFFTAFLLTILALLSKGFTRRLLLQIAKVLQSLPDFSYVFLIQIAVVTIFEKTGLLVLNFYSLGGDRIFLAPVLCLAVLPTLLFFKLFMLLYEKELEQSYVDLALSKGLSRFEVVWKHCTSNVLKSVLIQSKSIVWLTLSSLLIIEYLFGINGILYYLRSDFSPAGIAFILLAIFTPFMLFYAVLEMVWSKPDKGRNAIFEKFNLRLLDKQEVKTSIQLLLTKDRQDTPPFLSQLYRSKHLLLPVFIVLGLLVTSLLYAVITGDQIEQIMYVYNESGGIESSAPHPPSQEILFGTDPFGYSIAQQLMVGIKYTILLSLLIATLRVGLGYLSGIVYTFFLSTKIRNIVNAVADGMHFLPLSLLVYILLIPVLIGSGEWDSPLWQRLLYQAIIMSAIVLPVTTSAIGNEMNESLKEEYVISSVLMGGSLSWILTKHIQPQIWPKLLLMWVQHIIQILQIFVHLGILSVFVGGALYQPDSPRLVPEIYELSGMIAISREVFITKQYWMILPPLLIFIVLIYCFTTIAERLAHKQELPKPVLKTQAALVPALFKSPFTRIERSKVSDENEFGKL